MERTGMLCTPGRKKPCRLTVRQYREQVEAAFGPRASLVLGRYPSTRYGTPSEALSAVMTDFEYARPALDTAAAFSRYVPTYVYEFADRNAPFFTDAAPVTFPTGAYHTAELPYLFTVDYTHRLSAEQERLSDAMVGYWSTFARRGEPNSAGLPPWTRFGVHHRYVQRLTTGDGGIAPTDFERDHHIDFWRSFVR
jgi:para-nitrobenzyl esterase